MRRMPGPVEIAMPDGRQLADGARLLGGCLGFEAGDAVPAWLMRTTDECGGLTLVALAAGEVAGVSYAVPAFGAAGPEWLSCGLAVAPAFRGRGVGRALKLEQRRRAVAAGVRVIRWTADAGNVPALRLYLSGLGARLVGYRPGRHRGLRAPTAPDDDVDIVWRLAGPPPAIGAGTAVPLPGGNGGTTADAYRRALRAALDLGLVGVAVDAGPTLRMAREAAA
jgi:ribosomal protein S18 acetylase RimI-like enzyme